MTFPQRVERPDVNWHRRFSRMKMLKELVASNWELGNKHGINPSGASFCSKCGGALNLRVAMELDEKRASSDDMLTKGLQANPKLRLELVKTIIDMGLAKNLN